MIWKIRKHFVIKVIAQLSRWKQADWGTTNFLEFYKLFFYWHSNDSESVESVLSLRKPRVTQSGISENFGSVFVSRLWSVHHNYVTISCHMFTAPILPTLNFNLVIVY